MKRPNSTLLSLGLMMLMTAACVQAAETTKESLEAVKKKVDEKKAALVDVREKSEWDEGHLADSIFLPLSKLKKGSKKEELKKILPEDRTLYTFCVVGKRSLSAAGILEKQGYKVLSLKPGYEELVEVGFEKAKEEK